LGKSGNPGSVADADLNYFKLPAEAACSALVKSHVPRPTMRTMQRGSQLLSAALSREVADATVSAPLSA
jgi:hypothetical protein